MKTSTLLQFILLLLPLGIWAQPNFILPDERRPVPSGGMVHLELQSMQVNTKITGQSATTALDQTFYNQGPWPQLFSLS